MGLRVVEEGHASWWPLGNSIKVGETLSHFISENVYMDTHSETDPGCSLGETSSSNLERIELCAISQPLVGTLLQRGTTNQEPQLCR